VKRLTILFVLVFAMFFFTVGVAWGHIESFKNNTGEMANDLHIWVYSDPEFNDPVDVTRGEVTTPNSWETFVSGNFIDAESGMFGPDVPNKGSVKILIETEYDGTEREPEKYYYIVKWTYDGEYLTPKGQNDYYPVVEANISNDWVTVSNLPTGEGVQVQVYDSQGNLKATASTGFFAEWGAFYADFDNPVLDIVPGDQISVLVPESVPAPSYPFTMIVQDLTCSVDLESNRVFGNAGYQGDIQVFAQVFDTQDGVWRYPTVVDGSYLADFADESQGEVFDIRQGDYVYVSLRGPKGHLTSIFMDTGEPVATIQGKVFVNGVPSAGTQVIAYLDESYAREMYGEIPEVSILPVSTDANGSYTLTIPIPGIQGLKIWIYAEKNGEQSIHRLLGALSYAETYTGINHYIGTVSFNDLTGDHWAYGCIADLAKRGLISGYPNNTFQPTKMITRAEFTKLIVAAMGWDLVTTDTPSFTDVPKSFWAYKYIETAKVNGVISGFLDGTFRPNNNITRAEIVVIIIRAKNYELSGSGADFTDVPADYWARDYILTAKDKGIVSGYPDNTFRPTNYATRAEAVKMVYEILNQ
jgi:hypothetical protein